MKKLLVSLLAIAGLVACTNDEVVSVQQGNPIAFDTFVENTTRVGYDSSNLPDGFNVWAFMENANGRSTILDAEDVERQDNQYVYGNTQYWVPDNTYYFAALAPMDSQNVTNLVLATGDAAKKGLGTFDFNNDNGTEDLIYAVNMVEADENTRKVTFTFKHLLSKVKFSFTNTFDNANYSIEVRDIVMTVPETGTVNLAADKVEWTLGSTFDLNFGATDKIAKDGNANSAELLTIPAGEGQVYGVTFKVDLYVGNGTDKVLAKTYEKNSTISGIEFEAGKAYNFAAAINAESLELSEVIFDASVDDWDNAATVQLIDTAAELRDAFGNENVNHIILDGNIDLDDLLAGTLSTRAGEPTYGLLIPAGRTLTLDLNGCTISQSKAQTGAYAMIDNKGILIIEDNSSRKEGKIVYGDTGNGGEYASNTIWNRGVLTINSGTIENNSTATVASNGYPHPIDNYGVLTINGGTFTNSANYSSMRIWCTTDDDTIVTINGGTFNGSIDFQTPNASANKGTLTINGGTFNPDTFTNHSVRLLGFGTDVDEMNGYIKGGHFTGKIGLRNFTSNEFNSQVFYITGGTFTVDPSEFVDSDYNVVENNGVYSLALKNVIAKIGDVEYRTLQKAFDAVDNGTIQLVDNVTLVETATLAEGKTATLDLNGKTLAHAEMATKYAINNLGTLTITGNGTVNSRGIYNGYGNGEANVASATLTIENGTFNAKGENGGAAVFNYGTANINGGSFTSIGGYSLNNQNGSSMTIADGVTANNGVYTSDATLTLNGGEISGNRSGCHVIYCWNANITINGGTFYNNNHGNSTVMAAGTTTITYNGGTYSIKDGRVPGNGNTWTSCLLDSANSATAVINGGTYNGGFRVQDGTSMTINGGSFNDCYGSAYNIYGTATVKGGTYTDAAAIAFAKKYVAEGYVVKESDGGYTVEEYKPTAKVGNVEYGNIDDAIKAWTNNTTLTLMSDVTLSDVVNLNSTEHHILDLGTYTMTAASGKNAFEIIAKGTGASERTAITIKADANNPGSINAGSKSVVYYNYANGTATGDDRPIIKIEGGIFRGATSSFGTAGIYFKGGSAARQAATLNISGGEFYCSINGQSKSKLLISGGLFHYSVGSQGDSTANRLIWGGTFKTLGFMTADSNNTKFWFGTSMGNSNVGLYINDDNYLVVGGPVITEFGDKFAAKATNATKWSSYLQYSSAAANGLYYTNADMAIKKHGAANVELHE